jgi:localization factor PodJL
MNTRRSYLDTLNAGRQRRPEPALDDLDRTLASLEGRYQREPSPREPAPREPLHRAQPARERAQRLPLDSYAPRPRASTAGAPDLRALAREMETARRQEEGFANASRIATELKAMREELRTQMSQAMKREFETLRHDIQRLSAVPNAVSGQELGAEFERLSDAVRALSEKGDDRSVNLLRLELEQVKSALDSLAREDTLKTVGRKWDDLDRKWSTLETKLGRDAAAPGPDVSALSAQLERISESVSSLPESLSLRALDERVRMLAGTVDQFATQYAKAMPEALGLIEQRLDEISRAVAVSGAATHMASFDPEPFERIEARVSGLARQIEELMDDQPSAVMLDQLSMLSRRVDDIAERVDVPEAIVERLGQQIAAISSRLEREPDAPRADLIFNTFDERFAELSDLLERRQGDAMEQGSHLFSQLEQRLDEVSMRIEQRAAAAAPAVSEAALLEAIENRFADLTARLQGSTSEDRTAIVGLEARLDNISQRLEQSAQRVEGMDPAVIRSLESQVAALSAHLTRPGTPLPEFEDLAPRLDHIERSITGNREAILDAARRAAQDAVEAMERGTADTAAITGFAAEVKALEAMTRKSDERNSRTFEAIHDMLLKVVDRLGSLEQGSVRQPKVAAQPVAMPAADFDYEDMAEPRVRAAAPRSPAEAAAAAALHAAGEARPAQDATEGRRSMLSGLTRAFRKEKDAAPVAAPAPAMAAPMAEAPVAPSLDEPLDARIANQPLEPGSGAPDLNAIIRRVRDEAGSGATSAEAAKSDFIAAARRAAQAAAAEAQTTKRGTDLGGAASKLKLGELLKNRRKSVLMAATALIVALGAWQVSRAFLGGGDRAPEIAQVENLTPAPVMAEALPAEPRAAAEEPAVRVLDSLADAGGADAGAAAEGEEPETMASVEGPNGFEAAPAGTMMTAAPAINGAASAPTAATPMMTAPAEAGPVALREAADGGDPKAMFEIASRYAEGRGVTADLAMAAEWYRQSAELGYAPAQYRLGNFYEKGNGVQQDAIQAMAWYDKAAKQGNASAMHNLAVLHAMGATGTPDNDAAARWFIEAAELGVTDSQYNLGILAAKGAGVPQSLEESYKWFSLVAKAGDRDAASKRDEVAKALRPEQLEKAKAATELWKPRPVDAETNVVDIPEEWTEGQTQTASVPDMKAAVRNIQAILSQNGYDAGAPDGVMGAKTKSAIMAFQADNGMDATGEITEQLVKVLLERR